MREFEVEYGFGLCVVQEARFTAIVMVGLDVFLVQMELDVANNCPRTVKWSIDLLKRPSYDALGTTMSQSPEFVLSFGGAFVDIPFSK